MNPEEFKEYVDLWSMRMDQAAKGSWIDGRERVRELLIECLVKYGGKLNKEKNETRQRKTR